MSNQRRPSWAAKSHQGRVAAKNTRISAAEFTRHQRWQLSCIRIPGRRTVAGRSSHRNSEGKDEAELDAVRDRVDELLDSIDQLGERVRRVSVHMGRCFDWHSCISCCPSSPAIVEQYLKTPGKWQVQPLIWSDELEDRKKCLSLLKEFRSKIDDVRKLEKGLSFAERLAFSSMSSLVGVRTIPVPTFQRCMPHIKPLPHASPECLQSWCSLRCLAPRCRSMPRPLLGPRLLRPRHRTGCRPSTL